MLISNAIQVLMLAALLESQSEAATTAAVKLCGRKLSEIMSRVCHVYNSPSWDNPTVVEQPAAVVRKKRQVGIADQCCKNGCTREQLNEYCAISSNSESSEDLETHMIADRSAEENASLIPPITVVSREASSQRGVEDRNKLVGESRRGGGKRRRGGYGRCPCRRKRRSGRRRFSLGNMELVKNAARAAPVVGTVSPLLTWGRTLNTDLPPAENGRYAYVLYT